MTLQIQANFGGVSKNLRLWLLTLDSLREKETILERIIADQLPNEGDLASLVKEARGWASRVPASLLISDGRSVFIILSAEFALGVVDHARGKQRVFTSNGGLTLRKEIATFPDDTLLVLGPRPLLDEEALDAHANHPPIASEEIGAWLNRSSAEGPIALLHLRAAAPEERQVRSGVTVIKSDRGLVKDANEDSGTALSLSHASANNSSSFRVISIADGVGGAAYGELASKIAASAASASLCRALIENASIDRASMMNAAYQAANDRVEKVVAYVNKPMASTLTMSLLEGNRLRISHAGDTRAYEVDFGNGIKRLTTDHRLSENGRASHVITRAIGSRIYSPEVGAEQVLKKGNILLTCTDGLHDVVNDDEILQVCNESGTPRELSSRLIMLANSRGGPDNITVAVHYA